MPDSTFKPKTALSQMTGLTKTPAVSGVVSAKGNAGGKGGNIVKMDDPIGTAKVTCNALNVRKGPGMNYERIGGVTKGKTLTVYKSENGWLKVGYGSDYGWVSQKYTDYKDPVVQQPEPTQPEPTTPEPTTPEPTTPELLAFSLRRGVVETVRDLSYLEAHGIVARYPDGRFGLDPRMR